MSDHVEVGGTPKERRRRNGISIGIRRVCQIARDSSQVCRRRHHSLRDKFGLMILLPRNRSIFFDRSTIIVRSVATGLAQIPPIRAAISHVDIEDAYAVAEIVLEKHPFEF